MYFTEFVVGSSSWIQKEGRRTGDPVAPPIVIRIPVPVLKRISHMTNLIPLPQKKQIADDRLKRGFIFQPTNCPGDIR